MAFFTKILINKDFFISLHRFCKNYLGRIEKEAIKTLLLCFINMDMFENIKAFFREEEKNGYFLVDVKALPQQKIMIFADSDKGISISECAMLHRRLIDTVTSAGDYDVTLSSPGLDEPFKVMEQYRKNLGKTVDVVTLDGQKIIGKLTSAGNEAISIEETTRQEQELHTIPLQEIKSTRLSISFKKPKP
jgi:ribosome maturation factor RimP